jgi:molybdopterin-binding protein
VTHLRISECAQLLGVSDDTVRRLVESGRLPATVDEAGRKVIEGARLAAYVQAHAPAGPEPRRSSARNRFRGLVTRITTDTVMAQVEMQCGPFRVVSLMSTEAAAELDLAVGSVADAVVKATTVIVETS